MSKGIYVTTRSRFLRFVNCQMYAHLAFVIVLVVTRETLRNFINKQMEIF
jgi:hypothetical protein